ncbi:MAG: hypothetical protein ABI551_24680, partial [Polyangiaceae bacterium]
MPAFGLLVLFLLIRWLAPGRLKRAGTSRVVTLRMLVWFLLGVGSLALSSVVVGAIVGLFIDPSGTPLVLVLLGLPVMAFIDLVVFAPFRLLQPLAKRGKMKLVYYASH